MSKLMRAAIVLVVVFFQTGCERYALDQQMEDLCKKDGGVKVYETVTLSPEQYEAVFNYVASKKGVQHEDYYGPDFKYVSSIQWLHGKDGDSEKGQAELMRSYSAIYRRRDDRLLGESVWYGRVGGDLTTLPFGPSDNSCPRNQKGLAHSVFLKGDKS